MRKVDPEGHASRRNAILDAARRCFAVKGFHRTSTAEICRAAQISSGNLFHYFATKQEIIIAIVEADARQTAAYFRELDGRDDPFDALLNFIDEILRLAGDPSFSQLAVAIAAEADPVIAGLTSQNDRELQRALEGLLGKAATRGQIEQSPAPKQIAAWIMVWIDGLFSRVTSDPTFALAEQRSVMHTVLRKALSSSSRNRSTQDRPR